MKKAKKIILSFIIFVSLSFLFAPFNFPSNPQIQAIFNSPSQNDVIIIFNPGGFGNVPLEKAKDFAPIIERIQEILNEQGYNSIVIPYKRTKNDFLGKIGGIKESFRSFQDQSEKLAIEINNFLEKNPDKKIIMAGLSNGAAFVNETMKKISINLKNNIFAIEIGTPFWEKPLVSENVLFLDNNGKDPLSKGEIKTLFFTFLKAPIRLISSRFLGKNLSFSQAFYIPGHDYKWNTVGPKISTFLEEKFSY